MTLDYKFPIINGTKSDRTGGTWTNLLNGWFFFETDTKQYYYWNGSSWLLVSSTDTLADVAKTGNYTTVENDSVIRCDASGGAFTITLLSAATVPAGKQYTIKRTDILSSTNALTIATTSSQTIDGATNWILRTGQSVKVESDGANWQVVDRSKLQPFRKNSTENTSYLGGSIPPFTPATAVSTTLPAINTLYAVPLLIENVTKFDLITFRITTVSTAGTARCGIYRDNGNLYPGALIFDTGSIDTTVTPGAAPRSVSTTITSGLQVFTPDVYWLAWECGVDAPQIKVLTTASSLFSIGQDRNIANGNPYYAYTVAHTFGALPDPFTASATPMQTTPSATNPIAAIGLRPV